MAIPYVTEEMERARHAEYIRRRIEEEKQRLNRQWDEVFTPIPTSVPTPHIDRALADLAPAESENDRIWRLLRDAARGT